MASLSNQNPPDPNDPRPPLAFDRRLIQLKRRLVREATMAIGMLETALDALWRLDRQSAKEVTRLDDRIDREEV